MKSFAFTCAYLFLSTLQIIKAEVEDDCWEKIMIAEAKGDELYEAGELPECCMEWKRELDNRDKPERGEDSEEEKGDMEEENREEKRLDTEECMETCREVILAAVDDPPSEDCIKRAIGKEPWDESVVSKESDESDESE